MVEVGLVPFGSIGMTVFAVDLYFASHAEALVAHDALTGVAGFLQNHRHWRVLADLFCWRCSAASTACRCTR